MWPWHRCWTQAAANLQRESWSEAGATSNTARGKKAYHKIFLLTQILILNEMRLTAKLVLWHAYWIHLLLSNPLPCAQGPTWCVIPPTYLKYSYYYRLWVFLIRLWVEAKQSLFRKRLLIIFILCKKGKFSELFSSCTQSYDFNAFHIHAENPQSCKNESNINFSKSIFSLSYVHRMRKL